MAQNNHHKVINKLNLPSHYIQKRFVLVMVSYILIQWKSMYRDETLGSLSEIQFLEVCVLNSDSLKGSNRLKKKKKFLLVIPKGADN